ncbi:MAG TPA: toll/interleukin-1 receptor domain-containing protein [Blastocatellia bacterium]|nr:toll/interleukin-1 receptor domain-containing protein [Blastocatellia bacterium]
MKIFISWSGPRSQAVATALHDWLRKVIHRLEPWVSASDPDQGAGHQDEIGRHLLEARFGIVCLTPENLDSRWISFEAGAVSTAVGNSQVWTYLLDLTPPQVEGPLSHLNHIRAEKKGTRELIFTINKALHENSIDEAILSKAFNLYWPQLEDELKSCLRLRPRPDPPGPSEMMQSKVRT